MAIDLSIYGNQPQQANPVQQAGSLINTLSGIQQYKQQKQQIAANQAISSAIQKHTGPDGTIDMAAVSQDLSQNPAAAYNLPQLQQQMFNSQTAQAQANMARFNEAKQQNDYWGQRLGGLLTQDNITANDVGTELINGVKQGMISPATAAQYASQVPSDPSKLKAWVTQHWVATAQTGDQLRALMPQTQVLNTGGQQQIVAINPLTGVPTLTGTAQNTLSPEAATSPVSFTGPGGQQITTTRQNFAGAMGGGAPQGYTGRYPGNQPAQQPQGAPGASGMPGGMVAGPTPAEQAAQVTGATQQAAGSAGAANQLAQATADTPVRLGYLKDAQSALANIQTGPGTDWRNQWASALQTAPGLGSFMKAIGVSDPNSIGSYDEFKKIMTNYAGSVSADSGTGTDARLNSAITGNANPGISKLANQDILVKTIAAEQYRAAKNQAWQNEINNGTVQPQQFNQWSAQWNKAADPAIFAFTNMNPEQQQAFIQRSQKDGSLAGFKSQLGDMVRRGLIQMPGQQ